jgi:hypothetical protein
MGGRVVEGTGLEKRFQPSIWLFTVVFDVMESADFKAVAACAAETQRYFGRQFGRQLPNATCEIF